jgi:alpha-L-fucosidase 2
LVLKITKPLNLQQYKHKNMNYSIRFFALVFILCLTSCNQTETQTQTDYLKLWYDQPAKDWQSEALPIGNGFMGTMFFGGIEKEQIQFAEGTLWSGGPGTGEAYNYGIKKDAWKHLAEVRRLLDAGKMDEAHQLANRELTGTMYKAKNSKSSFGNYGAQQTMGDLFIEVKHTGEVSDYIRELDIEKAEGRVSYTIGDTQYSRTYFASYPAKSMVYRFESNSATNYLLTYKSPHIRDSESFSSSTYSFQGHGVRNPSKI